jgi:CBS domain-containing protein
MGTNDLTRLRLLRDEAHELFQSRLPYADPLRWLQQVNNVHDSFIQRTIHLSEKMLIDRGMGPPPLSYAIVLFGSGGREEQTLWSDQDNGLIYEDPPDGGLEEAERYFRMLGDNIVNGLTVLGYPPCDGKVVCSNPLWLKSADQWKQSMRQWFADPHWEHARYLLILADMRCIYGNSILVDNLKRHFSSLVTRHRSVLGNFLHNTLHHKVLLNFFGRIIEEPYGEDAGAVDLKYGAYIPIVNCIRLLTIIAGLTAASSAERLEQLCRAGIVTHDQLHSWRRALMIIIRLRSMASFQAEDGLYSSRGKIKLKCLPKPYRHQLIDALRVCKKLQRFVHKEIKNRI